MEKNAADLRHPPSSIHPPQQSQRESESNVGKVVYVVPILKGLSYEIDFENVGENWQILALTRAAAGFWIFQRHLWFLVEIKHILSGKCWNDADSLCSPIIFVPLYTRQAFLTEVVSFYKQPIRGSVGFV